MAQEPIRKEVMETQTAAIRYELGDKHSYEFVEGTISREMAPEFKGMAAPDEDFFSYVDPENLDTSLKALGYLDAYIEAEGPFDGVMAFSQGALLIMTYLAQKAFQGSASPFKCAIIFSVRDAYDPRLLEQGKLQNLTPETSGEIIQIPTAHICKTLTSPSDATLSKQGNR
ncbi:hypothetical protein B0I35DRAFT_485347 [Stachybotrys elegans]|uniref:Serine hydrolase domain-containing protein n=1 Tax=Stachybotrys elegans TaxID=80388 RepID=A0A8K0WJR1_9HYPO|nr:hypothetical protein B0I35DRAFT_485347 [Stachybotrys elegans]